VRTSIAVPLSQFVTAVRAIAGGELTHRIPAGTSGSELTDLAHEFNRMANALEEMYRRLVRESEERLALESEMRRAEQMTVAGKLAAGLAHEVAAPLNVISGRTELVLKRPDVAPEAARNLRMVLDQIARISATVRKFLDVAGARESQRFVLDLAPVIRGTLELLDTEFARSEVEVVSEGPASVFVSGDSAQLHQVFLNLFLNAVQATLEVPGPRTLHVRTRLDSVSRPSGREVPVVMVEVADSGPGVPPDDLTRIFEPFVTTKAGGTGLGLMVVRSIVEEHGGTIVAANRDEGKGAVFTLTFRLVGDPIQSHA
jgi:two-component system, NtrC family, sensor kinase